MQYAYSTKLTIIDGSYAARPCPSARYAAIERVQIEPFDRLDHEPREMILRQPIPQRRRQQKRLLTITINEILRHPGIQQTRPDTLDLCDIHRGHQERSHG